MEPLFNKRPRISVLVLSVIVNDKEKALIKTSEPFCSEAFLKGKEMLFPNYEENLIVYYIPF
jgi:hypothetical protein